MSYEFRNGTYAGVRYLVEDGKAWYRAGDVANVLGYDEAKFSESLRHFGFDREDGDYIPSGELTHVVDKIIGFDTETMRQLWVGAWYDDLSAHVEREEDAIDIFGGDATSDFLTELIAGGAKAAREEAESRMDDVRDALGQMGLALDTLQDCVTYLDGFRTGALMGSGDAPGIQNLFADLCGVEDSMTRVHSMLEDVVNGGGHEQ